MIVFGFEFGGRWEPGIDLAARSVLLLAAAWVTTWLMRRRSAAGRHIVWSLAIMGILVIPIAKPVLPAWRVLPVFQSLAGVSSPSSDSFDHHSSVVESGENRASVQTAAAHVNAGDLEETEEYHCDTSSAAGTPQMAESFDFWGPIRLLVQVGWLAGAGSFCLPTLFGLLRVRELRRSSYAAPEPLRSEIRRLVATLRLVRRVEVLLSEQCEMPMTWGIFSPVILLPARAVNWSGERSRMVLLHELAHVQRWDCLTQLLGQAARALYWFNPLAWVALQRLRVEQECACDDFVLNKGTCAADYAAELLFVSARLPEATWDQAVSLAMSRTTRLEQRLNAILDSNCDRRPLLTYRIALTLGCMFALAAGIAVIQPQRALAEQPLVTQVAFVDQPIPVPEKPARPANEETAPAAKTELGFDNGDFEDEPRAGGIPPAWFPAHLKETKAFVKMALEPDGHTGKRSASISIDKTHPLQPVAYNWLARPHGWKAGQALEISGWFKTENVIATPVLVAQCCTNDNKFLAFASSADKYNITGTKDWTRVSTLVFVPPGTELLLVRAALATPANAGAKVYFDDFAIVETPEAEAKAATRKMSSVEQSLEPIAIRVKMADVPLLLQDFRINRPTTRNAEYSLGSVDSNGVHVEPVHGLPLSQVFP